MKLAVKNQRTKKKFHLRIPSQTEYLEIIREFVSRVARKVGFKEDDASKIELAVDEACTNVIEHAYGGDGKKMIDIAIQVDYPGQKMSIIITDQGRGFDPSKLLAPDMKKYLQEMRVGGLGVYLMQSLMDEINFEVKPGPKNQVKLVKYLMNNQRQK